MGIDSKAWAQSEAWQVLSPTRGQPFGTDDVNRRIQMEFRKGIIRKSQGRWSKSPRPFGENEIVWTDKVVQTRNRSKKDWAWPRDRSGLDYVANGEIGIVSQTWKLKGGERFPLGFLLNSA